MSRPFPYTAAIVLALVPCYAAETVHEIRIPLGSHITLLPAGFFQPIADYRGETTGDTVSTRFGRIPLSDTESEFLGSVAHSRLMVHAIGTAGPLQSTIYFESDFLNPPGERPFRIRHFFLETAYGKWRLTGGKTWSLLRPNRKGMHSELDLMNTHVIEPNYHVGIVGLRREQIRLSREDGNWQTAIAYESGGRWVAAAGRDSRRGRVELVGLLGTRGRRGMSLSGTIHAGRGIDLVSQEFWSQGGGPDILGLLPADVHAHSTVQGIEAHVSRTLEIYGYGGIAYGARSDGNRVVREWTAGFRQRLLADPWYGAVFFSAQYSQVDRALWTPHHGAMNYAMISLWYYLPGVR